MRCGSLALSTQLCTCHRRAHCGYLHITTTQSCILITRRKVCLFHEMQYPCCSNCCRSSRWISIGSHNGQGPPASPSFVLPRAMFVHEVRATCLTATTPCGVFKSVLSRVRQPWVQAFLRKRNKFMCPSLYRGPRKASDRRRLVMRGWG